MAQTPLNYNSLMFARNGKTFRYRTATITGATDLLKGQVLVLDTGKYRAALDADKATIFVGYRILLADAAVSGGDVQAPTGVSGGVFTDKIVGAGLAVDDRLVNLLEGSNIDVVDGTNAVQIAGEGV